ncbi:MAG TPA: glycosyltransferase [Candidatus Bathyarchaeia archaeon]
MYVRILQANAKEKKRLITSFVVPAHNSERNIYNCINRLFKRSEERTKACEIIVVDDGSNDDTYERAWSAIERNRARHPLVRAKVIRHSASLGKAEAIKTGASKALGHVVVVNPNTA